MKLLYLQKAKTLVKGVREVERSLVALKFSKQEIEIKRVHRPSLISKVNINKGQTITANMLTIKKPGIGISPTDINWVVGRKVKKNIIKNRLILKKDLV